MTISLRMEGDRNHMAERILNLTLEIIYLLTGEDCKVVRKTTGEQLTPSSHLHDPSPITVRSPHSLTPERKEKEILKVIHKMFELLTGEEWQYLQQHKDLNKETMMENQPLLISLDGSINKNPPERCTGPLYSQHCTQEDHTIPQHYQCEDQIRFKVEVKEEDEEVYESRAQLSTEEHEMTGAMKEEKDTYMRGDQQTTKDNEMMGAMKEEEVETYMRGYQRTTEDDEMIKTIKKDEKEEETYAWGDQQSAEEGEMMGTIRESECSLDSNNDRQNVGNTSEGSPISPPDYSAEDNGVTQYSSGANPITGNLHHRLDHEERSLDPSPEESSDRSHPVTPDTHLRSPTGARTNNLSNTEESSSSVFCVDRRVVEKIFSCSECDKRYATKTGLVFHQRRHTGDRLFSCAECGKTFPGKGSLGKHQNSHKGERPFPCSECGKSYSTKGALLMHQKIHTNERPFTCSECGKGFIQKGSLFRHQRHHTGERPFFCPECGKYFTEKGSLRKHQRIHTRERPFSCAVCGQSFTLKAYLLRHQKTHKDECPVFML